MKIIAFVSTVCAILTVAAAYGSYGSTPQPPVTTAGPPTPPGSNQPCPKNYLFSCQPNLAPVPCGSSAGSTGGHTGMYPAFGAFSENMPVYVNPFYGYQGLMQHENHVQ